jgi:GDP-mannose pyrophosphatase NudK
MINSNQTVRIVGTHTLADDKGKLTRVSFEQRTRQGDWRPRQREVYDNGDSATILPYDADRNTVLLARQFRLPIYIRDGSESAIEACAGKLDGETAEKRIIKEMEEELGYRIGQVDRLFELYVSPASVAEKITFFTCDYSPADKVSSGGGLADEGEEIEVVELTLDQARGMVFAGEIVDAKTVILIQFLWERVRGGGA